MAITDQIIKDFKDRMRIGNYEDDNLKRILEASEQDLLIKCGEFNIDLRTSSFGNWFSRERVMFITTLSNFLTRISKVRSMLWGWKRRYPPSRLMRTAM